MRKNPIFSLQVFLCVPDDMFIKVSLFQETSLALKMHFCMPVMKVKFTTNKLRFLLLPPFTTSKNQLKNTKKVNQVSRQ